MKIRARQYAEALLAAAEAGSDPKTLAAELRTLLIRQKRSKLLPAIIAALSDLHRERKNITPVTLATAREMDVQHLKKGLEKTLGSVELFTTVEPALLGGAVITINDMRIDASINAQLEQLRSVLRTTKKEAHA